MTGSFAAFLVVSAVVIATPGPDTMLTIRNTLVGGRRHGVLTALGCVTGLSIWTIATSAGLAALLIASRPAFVAIRVVGAAYLVVLGAQALLHAARHGRAAGAAGAAPAGRAGPWTAYRQGALSNLGNPKIAVFFSSLLPQFLPHGHATFTALLALGLCFCSMTVIWLTLYACAVARAGDLLRRPALERAMEALSGAVLVALGLRLATERD